MVLDIISSIDSFLYAGIVLIIWNFIWTKRLRNKVYGDGTDDTENGLAVDLEDLERRVDDLEDD